MYYLSSVLVENIIVKNIVIVNLFIFNAVQVGSMGRGGGLFQYLSKINYDKNDQL